MSGTLGTNQTHEMLEIFEEWNSQKPTSLWADFLAPLLALPVNEPGSLWKTQEAHLLLKCLGSHGIEEYLTYSLRTSKDSSTTTVEELSESSFPSWMRWGMTVNGNCLTAKTLESRNTENESSLSQILEDTPAPKYFLSDKQVDKMIQKGLDKRESAKSHNGDEDTFETTWEEGFLL